MRLAQNRCIGATERLGGNTCRTHIFLLGARMTRIKYWRATLALIFGMAVIASNGRAQSLTTGDITGTVTDASGAAVPSAKVTLKSTERGNTEETSTHNNGLYRFSLLPPGKYTVTIEANGFDTVTQDAYANVGVVTTADVSLKVGTASETVTVNAELPLLNTENGNTVSTISQLQVSQVPNPGNDLTYPVQITPGVVSNTAGGGLGNFAASGISASSNLFTIDGMDDNDPYLNLNNSGATNLMLGQNEIQEVSVVTNGYSGQYGGLAGANVNYITRSGANEFHGRAIWYWNGSALNANTFFHNATVPQTPKSFVNANQWGGDFGGRIIKDKLFFYFNTEGLRLVIPTSSPAFIPSSNFEGAVIAHLASTNNTGSIPFYQTMFNLYNNATGAARATPTPGGGCGAGFTALPGFGPANPCTDTFQANVSAHTNDRLYTGRVDYNIGNNDRVYLRIEQEDGLQASITDPINPLFNITSDQPAWQGQLNLTHTFGSAAVNQFLFSGQWYSAIFNNTDRSAALAAFPTTLTLSDGTLTNLGGFNSTFPQGRRVTQYQISDDFSRPIKTHTLKFGVKFRRNDVSDFYYGINTIGTVTVGGLNDFANGGNSPSTSLTQNFPSKLEQPMAFYTVGGYIEDSWRIKPNFLLTLALRLDHESNPVCQTNCFARTVDPFNQLDHNPNIPYNQAIQTGLHQALPNLTNLEWQPRLGFAWQPFGRSAQTVVRGGIGIFYDAFQGQVVDFMSLNTPLLNGFTVSNNNIAPTTASNLFNDAANSNTALMQGFANGSTLAQIQGVAPAFAPPTIFSTNANTKVPQYQKWNLELEQGLGRHASVSFNYVGNHGINELYGNSVTNAFCTLDVCPGGFAGLPLSPTDTRFGPVTVLTTEAVSNYNGLQSSFRYQFTGGVVQVSYAFSHALDMVSNSGINTFANALYGATTTSLLVPQDPNNPRGSYGSADYDVRHYFSANYVWELPFRKMFRDHGSKFLVDGWQVAGTVFVRSSLPFTPVDQAITATLAGSNYGTGATTIFQGFVYANFNGAGRGSCNTSTLVCLNPADFSAATSGFGDASRNSFRGPRFFNSDFSIMKKTKMPGWERGEFGLGFQFFNVFNHPNFDLPVNNVADPRFGTMVKTASSSTTLFGSGLGADASPRLIQLKLQFTF